MKKKTIWKVILSLLFLIIFCACASDDKQDDIPFSATTQILEVKNITENSAIVYTNIQLVGVGKITASGVCLNTEPNPTVENLKNEEKGGISGQLDFSFQSLKANTKYFARGYILTDSAIIYGNEITFVTTQNTKPIVSTSPVMMITSKTATAGGIILNNGTSELGGYGVYVSAVNPIPSGSDIDIQGYLDSNKFTCSLTGLLAGTKYYIRAYAINKSGISFGEVITFTTEKIGLTTIVTNQPNSIYATSAKVGGTISNDGGSTFTSVGVCVSAVNLIPTTGDAKTDIVATSENSFEVNLVGLKANTKYYTRAFVINSLGTYYGEVMSFTTKEAGVPVLKISTLSGSNLGGSGGALIISNGGEPITQYGFIWSKFENPDLSFPNINKTEVKGNFPDLNYFNATIKGGIFPNTTHYVRAYATNSHGTGYSQVLTFTTTNN